MENPVEVPMEIYKGIEMIRKAGVNMEDYQAVLSKAEESKDTITATWLHNNMKYYLQSIYYGLLPEGASSESCHVQSLPRQNKK